MLQKIKVVSKKGVGGALGEMNVALGMPTQLGYISGTGVSTVTVGGGEGNDFTFGAGSTSGYFNVYPNQLQIASGDAAAFGWPGGSDCVRYGHSRGVLANGSPVSAFQAGFVYMDGKTASQSIVPESGVRPDLLN